MISHQLRDKLRGWGYYYPWSYHKRRFESVLNAIITDLHHDPTPTIFPRYAGQTYEFWHTTSISPTHGTYQNYRWTYCREHKQYEGVPWHNYDEGLLELWYNAGLHPRWPIWTALLHYWQDDDLRRVDFQRMIRVGWGERVARLPLTRRLRKYKDDPKGFALSTYKHFDQLVRPVSMTAGGRRWTVTKQFRKKYKAKRFTLKDYRSERNQTNRRLMIMSRAISVDDVTKTMTCLSKDAEGEIWQDNEGQTYLKVKCPSTGEIYMLGVPSRLRKCQHGLITENWVAADGCAGTISIPMTPSIARRWSFGVPASTKFLAEA